LGKTADLPLTEKPRRDLSSVRDLPVLRAFGARLSLVQRIVLASALLAVLVGAAFVVLIVAVSSLRTTTGEANRSKDVTAATLVLGQNVLSLEAALRGYVTTGDPRFLRPWRDARSTLPASAAAVEEIAGGNAAQERRVRRLVASIDAYVEEYAVPLVTIAGLSPSAARTAVATAEGRRRLDAIRGQIDRVLRAENALSGRRLASAKSQASYAIIIGLAALGASVLLVLLFGAELARAVGGPVRRTSEAAKDVAGGNLSVRLPERGPSEVHDLSVAFNEMATSLERAKQELEAQNLQLRESERLRSELIGVISHEVRTPLACVMGYTSLLQTRDLDDRTRGRYLTIISDEARRLESLVDDLADFRRIEEGRLTLEEEPFDLGELLNEQAESFSGRSEKHSLRVDLAGPALLVRADRHRIAQVIANLLANAIKYSPEGGVIETSVSDADGIVHVSVRDDGVGIAEEYRPRIFTKFFRGGAAGHGFGGVGLGLAISREIIEAHGGRMGFESEVGHGSVFWFELPALTRDR
jgi:signal transduction histidine kinase